MCKAAYNGQIPCQDGSGSLRFVVSQVSETRPGAPHSRLRRLGKKQPIAQVRNARVRTDHLLTVSRERAGAASYLARVAVNSTAGRSPTVRVNLMASPSTLPV